MGAHSRTGERPVRDVGVYVVRPYRGHHVDRDCQPGRDTDYIPDDWFDPALTRNPDDPDLGVR